MIKGFEELGAQWNDTYYGDFYAPWRYQIEAF